jgi:hypothetical protein
LDRRTFGFADPCDGEFHGIRRKDFNRRGRRGREEF